MINAEDDIGYNSAYLTNSILYDPNDNFASISMHYSRFMRYIMVEYRYNYLILLDF